MGSLSPKANASGGLVGHPPASSRSSLPWERGDSVCQNVGWSVKGSTVQGFGRTGGVNGVKDGGSMSLELLRLGIETVCVPRT